MRFSVLASGSSGNACYIETEITSILIDAGLSGLECRKRLTSINVDPKRLDALIVTHEHSDHIRGVGPLSRHLNIPVYLNAPTLRKGHKTLGNLACPVTIQTGQTITINDLTVETFTKCHDAADPIGMVISSNGSRLGFITDLGRSTPLIEDRLKGCKALIIEFNHDVEMLETGPYPLELKRRIRGSDGHLSNHQAGALLCSISHQNLELVVLAHVSDKNNDQHRALAEVVDALSKCGLQDTRIEISHQDQPTPLISV